MKKILREVAGYIMGFSFALAPLILLIMFLTYTEQELAPALIILEIVCGIILITTNGE